MFSKNARWYFPGQDVSTVMHTVTGAAQSQGIMVLPTGPSRWEGTGSEWSLGVIPKMTIYLRPDQQGFWVDLHLTVDFGTGAIVLLVMGWVMCFPLAIVYLLMAHQRFEQQGQDTISAVFQPVSHMTGQPPMPAFGAPPRPWG